MQYFISHYNKECELTIPEDLIIYDTTLRDGEQTPGVCFSFEDKIEIAHKLDQFKINQIEAGFPIVSERERESVSAIAKEGLDADILALTRTKPEDIDAALDCDVDGVITFVGTSDIHLDHKMHITRQDAINLCESAVDYAKDHGLYVAFSAEDATRTDIEFLKRIYSKAQECGADRVHIADTTGAITPQGIDYMVRELVKDLKVNIGCVYPKIQDAEMDIRGRDLRTGLPKTITVRSSEMLEALIEPAMMIVDAVHSVLEKTPPELAADISDKGIYMTGGGCLVDGLDKLLQEKTGINVMIAQDAISCVALGTGKALDNLDALDGKSK